MSVLGIDISQNQPNDFPFPAAAAWGARFCYMRATDGAVVDTAYHKHYPRARAAGLLTGSYGYIYPWVDMARQAAAFCHEIEGNDDELWPVVDVEADGLTMDMLRAWEWEFARHDVWARPLMVYTSAQLWHQLMGDASTEFDGCPLWCADYGPGTITSKPLKPAPALPRQWPRATIYQFAGDNGRIPGYDGRIDLDLMSDLDAAKKLVGTIMGNAIQLQEILTGMDNPPPPTAGWWDKLPAGLFGAPINYPVQPAPYNLYGPDGKLLAVKARTNAGQLYERQGDLLRVTTAPPVAGLPNWWVRAEELTAHPAG